MKEVRLFFDMDGVLAKWEEGTPIEVVKAPGHFLGLKREPALIELANRMTLKYDTFSMSKHFVDEHSVSEKQIWLTKNGVKIPFDNRIFVPYHENKSDYIPKKDNCIDILFDDYTENLENWSGIGVKVLNGINSIGSWTGQTLSIVDKTVEELFEEMKKTIEIARMLDDKRRTA